MSSDDTHAGVTCPCGEGCCHWSHHSDGVDLWCSATAVPGTVFCPNHTPPPPEGTQP
jgi:hypothetical protein